MRFLLALFLIVYLKAGMALANEAVICTVLREFLAQTEAESSGLNTVSRRRSLEDILADLKRGKNVQLLTDNEWRYITQIAGVLNQPALARGTHSRSILSSAPDRFTQVFSRIGCVAYSGLASDAYAGDASRRGTEKLPGEKLLVVGLPGSATAWLPVIALILTTVAFVAGFIHLIVVRGRRGARKICRTTGLLRFGDQCTLTHVIDVSRNGAKLEAPEVDIPTHGLALYIAGHRMDVHVRWRNHLFMGLKFAKPLDPDVITSIYTGTASDKELETLKTNSPSCFFPQCHLNCKRHCPTGISLGKTPTLD